MTFLLDVHPSAVFVPSQNFSACAVLLRSVQALQLELPPAGTDVAEFCFELPLMPVIVPSNRPTASNS